MKKSSTTPKQALSIVQKNRAVTQLLKAYFPSLQRIFTDKDVLDAELPLTVLRDLKKQGTSLTVKNSKGATGLHITSFMLTTLVEKKERFRIFLASKVDINTQTNDGYQRTALHQLISNEAIDLAVTLITLAKYYHQKINYNLRDFQKKSLLVHAAKINSTTLITFMLSDTSPAEAININSADSHGLTALHYAALYGNLVLVEILLDHGASIESKDVHGQNPLQLLVNSDKKTLMQIMSSVNINPYRDVYAKSNLIIDQNNSIPFVAHLCHECTTSKVENICIPAIKCELFEKTIDQLNDPELLQDGSCVAVTGNLEFSDESYRHYLRNQWDSLKGESLIAACLQNQLGSVNKSSQTRANFFKGIKNGNTREESKESASTYEFTPK